MADNELLIRINGNAKDFLTEVDKIKKKTKELEKVLETTAKTSATAFAGFAAVIAGVTKAFADYETALVGVGKTTNIGGKQLEKFGKEFQKLSEEIPLSTNELLGIAQAAGQLGVTGEKNLLKFTDTVAKLGVATDLTGEEAAVGLTRILNVTGEAIEEIDTFGSVIVALGNNFAATESEILRVTTEVSRSTSVFGVSSAQAAALATALKSVGVQAQLGGSAVGRGFRAIDAAIRGGGQALKNLEQITGLTGDKLKETFEENSAIVFQKFIEGLGSIQEAGGSTTDALAAFGLKGDEILKVLPVLAQRADLVGKAFATAGKEVKDATALNEEAEKAFKTLGSEFTKTKNAVITLATNVGAELAPEITELLISLRELVQEINEADSATVKTIATFVKWGTIITGAIATVSTFALGLVKLTGLVRAAAAIFKVARLAVIGFSSAATFGLTAVLAFLPEIISGVETLVSKFKEAGEPRQIQVIQKELEKTNALIDKINEKGLDFDPRSGKTLEDLGFKAEKLKKELEAALAASNKFEDGSLLERPKFAGDNGEAVLDFDLTPDAKNVPLAPEETDVEKKARERAEKQQKIRDEATAKRIEAAKEENAQLQEIRKAEAEGATQEEIEFLQRKQEIQAEFAEAEKIKNAEERETVLENLRLKHSNELEEIEAFEDEKDLRDEERRAVREELENELREAGVQRRQEEIDEDIAAEIGKLDTQKEAEQKFAREKLQSQIKERNQFKQDEIKFGTEVANLKAFFRKEEVQGFKSASGQLAQLSRSRNSTLKGIGKAAARVNAAIATAEGAIKAYTSLAGIPIIGPALGVAAAGALIAFGVEQQAKISAAQTGGFVPPAGGGARDRVPMLLEPNELVVPSALSPNFIQAVGNPSNGQFANDDATAPEGTEERGVLRLEGDLVQNDEFVTAVSTKINELKEFENLRAV